MFPNAPLLFIPILLVVASGALTYWIMSRQIKSRIKPEISTALEASSLGDRVGPIVREEVTRLHDDFVTRAQAEEMLQEKLAPLEELSAEIERTTGEIRERTAPSAELVERIEVLERRFERLHGDALKYLQRGSQAESRARRLREEELEEEPDPLDPEPPRQLPAPPQPAEEDLRAWAYRRAREMGETPSSF